ncbi:MAG: hypothetical protein JWQ13_2092 [Ramlibacter sp.]|jgi:hypothetical protein|nr:hypothetical protein [Ramlibacter sp.]
MKFRLNPLACSLGAVLTLTLAGCGGGGGGEATPDSTTPVTTTPEVTNPNPTTPPPPPAPVTVTLTGAVMGNQAIRNAVVCMDINANAACDPDEPASARTGADGAYSLTYDTAKVTPAQVAAASLIAPMVPGAATDPTTTIDAAEPGVALTARAYVLRQVPGKSGQINPLTTLVAKGIADGMTEAAARSNAAVQLNMPEAEIDNYQNEPPTNDARVEDSTRWAARALMGALEQGVVLRVGDQTAAIEAGTGDLAQLRYTDADNYFVRTFERVAKAAGALGVQNIDARSGRTNGSATPSATLYNFAYLGPTGWIRCDGPWNGTIGTPSRSTYCGAQESVGFNVSTSIAGRTMTSVVTEMQADPATNVINNGVSVTSLVTALGNAVFPAGSSINARNNLTLSQAVTINSLNTDGRPQSEAQTLEQLIAAKPASAVVLPSPNGSLTLGLGSGDFKNLRVAFTGTTNATSGTVQFYECALDSTLNVASNCAAKETGTYSIATVNGARVMRFAGHAPTVMNHDRVYAEVQNAPTVASGNWVYQARENKPETKYAFSVQKRLNATAWAAMAAQLGIGGKK